MARTIDRIRRSQQDTLDEADCILGKGNQNPVTKDAAIGKKKVKPRGINLIRLIFRIKPQMMKFVIFVGNFVGNINDYISGESSMKKAVERADELELLSIVVVSILKVSFFLDKILMITSLTMANLLLWED